MKRCVLGKLQKVKACDIPVMAGMCATCPFRAGSKFEGLRTALSISALSEASRVCHSTGVNALARTAKPLRLCRGARDLQLAFFAAIGFINAPTDAAFAAKWKELKPR